MTDLAAAADRIEIQWEPRKMATSTDRSSRGKASQRRLAALLPFVPFLVALGLAIYRALGPAATPDEVAFLQTTVTWRQQHGSIIPPNLLGYGSGWWSVLTIISAAFHAYVPLKQDIYLSTASSASLHALATSRLLSVLLLFGALGFAMLKAPNRFARWVLCAFLLLPLVWFSGKWSAPDLPAVAMAIMAASCLARGKTTAAALWMGIDIGLRVSNLFIVGAFFVLALYVSWRERGLLRGVAMALVAITGGYLIGNPYVLLHPLQAIQNTKGIAPVGVTNQVRIAYAKDLFSGGYSSVEWDSATRGSLLFWYGSPLVVGSVLAYQLVLRKWALFVASITGAAALIAVVAYRGLGYGWYLMPWVAFSFVVTATGLPPFRLRAWSGNAVTVVLCIGLVLSLPVSFIQLDYVMNRSQSINGAAKYESCILNALPKGRPVANAIDPVVIPNFILTQRDGQPSYYAMRMILDSHIDPNTLVVITTRPVLDKIGFWVKPILNSAQERVYCGPYIIGRPISP